MQDRGDRVNTRVKDIVDLSLFSRMNLLLPPDRLRAAIEQTFAVRGTPVPRELPIPPSGWAAVYGEAARNVDVPPTVEAAWREARNLLKDALAIAPTHALEPADARGVALVGPTASSPEQFEVAGMRRALLHSGAVSYMFEDLSSRAAGVPAFRDDGDRIVITDSGNARAARAAGAYAHAKWSGAPVALTGLPASLAAALPALARSPVELADRSHAVAIASVRAELRARPLDRGDAPHAIHRASDSPPGRERAR